MMAEPETAPPEAIMQGLTEDLANDVKAVLQRQKSGGRKMPTSQYNQVQNELNAYKASYRDAVQAISARCSAETLG